MRNKFFSNIFNTEKLFFYDVKVKVNTVAKGLDYQHRATRDSESHGATVSSFPRPARGTPILLGVFLYNNVQ